VNHMNTVRDGKKVWPTCPECSCRLDNKGDRGCKCSYTGLAFLKMGDNNSLILTAYNRTRG
jgi:tRNA(Ile2) C34 agmatinyltransferase TiaS